jgi:gamma-glutamyltranspeptidase / glutathione hydrolase
MTPVIVMHESKPVLAVATVGSSLIFETVRILLGALGNRLDLKTVMEAPPLLYNLSLGPTRFVPEEAYGPDFLRSLDAAGVHVEGKSRAEVLAIRGTAVVGAVEGGTQVWRSVETPKLFAFASGY